MKTIIATVVSFFLYSIVNAQTLTIHAVGDILLHKKLQRKGIAQGFEVIWQPTIPFLQQADLAYANLEGPIAEDINKRGQQVSNYRDIFKIYSSFPMFNYHPSLAASLKRSGIDIVSTANNHSLDRYGIGIDKTITALDKVNIDHVGTQSRITPSTWYKLTQQKDITLAWISCTQDTNGIPDPAKQVLYCYKKGDNQKILDLIRSLQTKVDAIIITPHWGVQYQIYPNKQQKLFARQWLEQGATIILGSHPHVIQPIQYYQTKDGRRTLIAYSLGNFVSNQGSLKNRSSGVLALKLTKENNTLEISQVTFYPTYMQNRGGKLHLEWVTSTRHPSYRHLKRIVGQQFIRLQKEN